MKLFAVVVCTFHKESLEIADFDPLCLKNYFEFPKAVEKSTGNLFKDVENKVNLTKKCLSPLLSLKHFKIYVKFLKQEML